MTNTDNLELTKKYTELLLTGEQLDWGAKKLDDAFFHKGIMDIIDQPAFRVSLGLLNKGASPYIPDEYKPLIQEALNDVIKNQYSDAAAKAINVISNIISEIEKMNPTFKEVILSLLLIIKAAVVAMLPNKDESVIADDIEE